MGKTPNFDLNRPQKGDTDWHIPLNENSTKVDGALPIVDTYDNRANYAPADGQAYLAHDTGQWFRYDGSAESWESVSAVGNAAISDVGTDTQADAIAYRLGWKTGGYKGIVFRDGTTFSDPDDFGVVLQSVADHLKENFSNGAKGGAGQIFIPRNQYFFSTQARITGDGTKLVGGGEYQQGRRWTGPVFANSSVPDGNGMVFFDEAEGSAAYGITFAHSGTGCHGLEIYNSDNVMLYGLENYGDMTSGARSLYVRGSYNSNMDNCYLYQVEMDEEPSLPKNINQWRIFRCDFRTANPDTPVLQLADGGNYMMYCIINSDLEDGDMNAGVPAVTGATNQSFQRWRFHTCLNIGNGGDPVYDHTGSCSWINCFLGGGNGPIFKSLVGCIVTGCRIAGKNEVLYAASDGDMDKARFTDNRVTNTCNISGDAALDLAGTGLRSKDFVIEGNQFFRNNGTYDIKLGNKNPFGRGYIKNNYFGLGLGGEEWGASAVQGTHAPAITDNHGYNPVGPTRTAPSLPTGTGSSNIAVNNYAQPVTVYLSGGTEPYDPTIQDHTGTEKDLNGSPKTLQIDRFGVIYFRSNVPSAWTWHWK